MQDEQQQTGMIMPGAGANIMTSSVIGSNGKELSDILKDNIRKVQSDPAYIPQAQAIADQVKEIINLAKVEVEMVKAVSSLKN